jgi:hypothetical protein
MLDGETIVMSVSDSSLFTLNEVATAIWNAADGRTSLEDIVRRGICAEFDVEAAEACADAETFCRELAGHGILRVSTEPIETIPPPIP